MPVTDPEVRRASARLAAFTRWSSEPDRSAATAPARSALLERFNREVDPEGILDPVLRAKLAASARSAFYSRMSLARAKQRAAKRATAGTAKVPAAAGGGAVDASATP
ncbi:MAG: hypothetical protein ACRENX_11370 [Candidatus Dormibacteria bacterium]